MPETTLSQTGSTLPDGTLLGAALLVLGLLGGCGAPAAPQPPTLNLPQPVRALTAERIAETVRLSVELPQKTTDRLPIVGGLRAQACRAVAAGPCLPVVTQPVPPGQKTAVIEDRLPAALVQGPPRLLTYHVALLNAAGRAAPEVTPVYAAGGAVPPAVEGFAVVPERSGVVLRWHPAVGSGANTLLRFDRVRTSAPPDPGADRTAPPDVPEQRLEVREAASSAALDQTAQFGATYRYTAQRFATVTLAEHTLEMMTAPTAPVALDYKDVFPPPVPTGLVSAVDTPAHAIDLSWSPDADPGLAGYVVYRRAEGGTPARVSPPGALVATPSWRDTTAVPGMHYLYSVSAVDQAGNESARSAEIKEQLQP